MAAVTLNANDAAELAKMLQSLADWLNRDPSRLGASLEDFVGHPAYNTCQLREDLDRFIFLLGGSDGESLFGPPSRGYAEPSRRHRRSSSRWRAAGALTPLRLQR